MIPRIQMEFHANFQGIPKIIPRNPRESQRIPKIDRSVIATLFPPW
jgi:phosphoribulokinase